MVLQINNYQRACSPCINLRQWAILFSILIFIIFAVVTTCTVLGTLHTKNLLKLLEDDIEEERLKSHLYKTFQGVNPNEEKLHNSQNVLFSMTKILSICMWLGWLNLVLAAVLIYGVTNGIAIYVIPWILLTVITYFFAVITISMGYFKMIPGFYISPTMMRISFVVSLIYLEMWFIIILYYIRIKRSHCLRSSSSPTIISAYGGYLHAIQPTLMETNKPMMV